MSFIDVDVDHDVVQGLLQLRRRCFNNQQHNEQAVAPEPLRDIMADVRSTQFCRTLEQMSSSSLRRVVKREAGLLREQCCGSRGDERCPSHRGLRALNQCSNRCTACNKRIVAVDEKPALEIVANLAHLAKDAEAAHQRAVHECTVGTLAARDDAANKLAHLAESVALVPIVAREMIASEVTLHRVKLIGQSWRHFRHRSGNIGHRDINACCNMATLALCGIQNNWARPREFV